MPKSTRKRAPTPPESESESSSEREEASTPPPRGAARPAQGVEPWGRHSMPGAYTQDSDDDRPQRAVVDFDPIEPDPSLEEMDEQTRQAIAASLREPQAPVSYEGDFDEEELRKVMEESMLSASTQPNPSFLPDDEEDLQQLMETSKREYEAQQRERERTEAELTRRQEEDLLRAMELSQREAQKSGHQAEEEALAKAKRLNHAANAEGVRRGAERMALERHTSTRSKSYTETSINSRQCGSSTTPSAPANPTTPTEVPPKPAAEPAKPKKSVLQSTTGSLSSTSRKPSVKGKPKSKASTLAAIPEDAVASSSTPSPSGGVATISASGAEPSKEVALAVTTPASPPSQALVLAPLRPPPIEPSALIALCEKAFPQDPAIAEALAASKTSAAIYDVQHGDDAVEAAQFARLMDESRLEHERTHGGPLDMTDIGLDDPPPTYHSIKVEGKDGRVKEHPIINHFKNTTSDYRREQWGYKKPLTDQILEIMLAYRLLLEWEAEFGPSDKKGRRKPSPFGPVKVPVSLPDARGKGKPSPFLALLPASNDPPASTAEQKAMEATPIAAPPEVAESLEETVRPVLRDELAMATPTPATQRVMASAVPRHMQAQARKMQAHSQMVSQSNLQGWRRRKEPEAHMLAFAGLPIEPEERPQVARAGSSGGGKKREPGYRRSGI
ncbi:MAG: hypothetical protein Q9208_005889 [Pyrenodesmia sp. 3 TL-2023]